MPDSVQLETSPSIIQIAITDLPAILSTIHTNLVTLRIPFMIEGQKRLAKVDHKFGETYPSEWDDPETVHELQRTAVELLIVTEIQSRLGFLLAEIVQAFQKNGTNVAAPFAFHNDKGAIVVSDEYIKTLFDLSKSTDIPLDCRAEFEVFDIALNSPVRVRTRIKKIISRTSVFVVLNCGAPALPPVATGGFSLPATVVEVVPRIAAAGGGVYTIVHTYQQEQISRQERISQNYGILARQLQRDNGSALQQGLSQLRNRDDLPYYTGLIDGRIGRQTKDAVRVFAIEHDLHPYIAFNDARLLEALSNALANAGILCSE